MTELEPRPPQPWQRYVEIVLLLAGVTMLVVVLTQQPLGDIYMACARMDPIVVFAPVVIAGCFAMRASALRLLLDREVSWIAALFTRLVGDGYNGLLPMAGLGGEPLKLRHLTRYVSVDTAVAALVRDRVIDNAFGLVVAAGMIAITLPQVRAPSAIGSGLWAFAAIGGAIGLVAL